MNKHSSLTGFLHNSTCSRRILLKNSILLAASIPFSVKSWNACADNPETGSETIGNSVRSHGLSSFGDLALPPDFPHFAYVNPDAPKGGSLIIQVKQVGGNQNFDTFNTLNTYVFRGDGAAGMDMVFDTLMVSHADEPDSMYGLLAHSVEIAPDKLMYRFFLRKEARFHDGSAVTADDVAFSLNILKEKGHYIYRQVLQHLVSAEADSHDILVVRFAPDRARDLHMMVASLPVFSKKFWETRDFEAITLEPPLGCGPYRVSHFSPGHFIEFERDPDYWGADLPVQKGLNNFDRIRYEYFRERIVAFEAFRTGRLTYHEEYTARIWATGYDFAAVHTNRIRKEELANTSAVAIQGWHFNTRLDKFKDVRIRKAIGRAFDFEWVNRNIMYSSYDRLCSYFQNTDMEAKGLPSPEELQLLEPFRDKLEKDVFGQPVMPPISDGSGRDRKLLKEALTLLEEAGCKKEGNTLLLPDGEPFTIEFLDFQASMNAHVQAFINNLNALGIKATSRTVDASQYRTRLQNFEFEVTSRALGGSLTPGDFLKNIYSSRGVNQKGSYNISGIEHPAVDFLVERIANAGSRDELNTACRALDRILRAGYYMVPMWFKASYWIAYWDEYSRPERKPKYDSGAPSTWWYDADKAKLTARTNG